MISGIWTSSDFQANSRSTSRFGRRSGLLVEIDNLLTKLHFCSDLNLDNEKTYDLLLKLYGIDKACQAWLNEHPMTVSQAKKGKKLSMRRRGIEVLRSQITKKRAELYKIPKSELRERKAITALYERSSKQLTVAPDDKDPRKMKARAAYHQQMFDMTIKQAIMLGHNQNEFNTEQLGYLAVNSRISVDTVIDPSKRQACYTEALRILAGMLGKNRNLVHRFATTGVEIIVLPADRPLTDLPEWAHMKNKEVKQSSALVSRTVDSVRGICSPRNNGKFYVAIPEENLLGTQSNIDIIASGCHAPQYSVASHEFAHAIHKSNALTLAQKQTITRAFKKKTKARIDWKNQSIIIESRSFNPSKDAFDALFSMQWVDGPRKFIYRSPTPIQYTVFRANDKECLKNPDGSDMIYTSDYELRDCYAAFNQYEFFAQCVNCYLGTNAGNSPYTGWPRNNGEAWFRKNEDPAMVRLLDELFSSGENKYDKTHFEDINVKSEPESIDDGVDAFTIMDLVRQDSVIDDDDYEEVEWV